MYLEDIYAGNPVYKTKTETTKEVKKPVETTSISAPADEYNPNEYLPLTWYNKYLKPQPVDTSKEERLGKYAKMQNIGSGLLTLTGIIGGLTGNQMRNTDPSKYNFAYWDEMNKNRQLAGQEQQQYARDRFNLMTGGYNEWQRRKAEQELLKQKQTQWEQEMDLKNKNLHFKKQGLIDNKNKEQKEKNLPGTIYLKVSNAEEPLEFTQTNFEAVYNTALNDLSNDPTSKRSMDIALKDISPTDPMKREKNIVALALSKGYPKTINQVKIQHNKSAGYGIPNENTNTESHVNKSAKKRKIYNPATGKIE
jgi:hypothetical protein